MKIKDLNLNEETILKIVDDLNRDLEQPYWDVDRVGRKMVHTEKDALSMMKWFYDDANSDIIIHELVDMKVINPQLSLFENMLLNHKYMYKVSENYWICVY